MRLRLETVDERDRKLRQWHKEFAFFPLYVGPDDFRWLETVEARVVCEHHYSDSNCCWEYRAISKRGK